MTELPREQETALTPQTEIPPPRPEETPTVATVEVAADWQGYSPEILSSVLDG